MEVERAALTELSRALFPPGPDDVRSIMTSDDATHRLALSHKLRTEYRDLSVLPPQVAAKQKPADRRRRLDGEERREGADGGTMALIEDIQPRHSHAEQLSRAIVLRQAATASGTDTSTALMRNGSSSSGMPGQGEDDHNTTVSLARRAAMLQVRPTWHAPWKLMRVVSGHMGWVRAVAFDPDNAWFCTGAGDRTIKIWDLARGTLRLSLTGHISTVRALAVSARHPYLFSAGEDKQVKCWDLETNKVIRHYHGHLSGVYALALHPTIDVLVSAGRDAVARVWDMRTRQNVHTLAGHRGTVADVKCQPADPQVISSSMDGTIRLWDLAAGKSMTTLTHHKKGVRALALHAGSEFSFASASADGIKAWKLPEGQLLNTFDAHTGDTNTQRTDSIVNTLDVNADNVLFSGADNGSMAFFDWKSGHRYQTIQSREQPGSLESEAGVFCSAFDRTGLRLVTGEADKTIKVWRQDETATPENTPLQWEPSLRRRNY